MINYTCCFCNNKIDRKNDFLASLLITVPFDAPVEKQFDQQLFCHFSCIQKKLSPQIPFYLKDIVESEFDK